MGADDAVGRAFKGIPTRTLAERDYQGLLRAFREYKTDIAYLFGQVRVIPWALIARYAGAPLIIGAERGSATRRANRFGRLVDRFFIDGYIANSSHAADTLVRLHGLDPAVVRVVCNGVELPGGDMPGLPPGLTSDGPRIVCIANITANKGHLVLARAVRRLQPTFPKLKAWFVGRDLSKGDIPAKINSENLGDMVEYAGFSTDVRPFLSRARAACLPSIYREGMPTSILEAMLAGVPVVASNVGGVSNLIESELNGLLVPAGDDAALAEALARVLSDKNFSARLANEATTETIPRYSLNAMCRNHLSAFHSLANER
jgi:glycosyltransferase involved in cell wall biosynthesis